jgi:hypothetical protein
MNMDSDPTAGLKKFNFLLKINVSIWKRQQCHDAYQIFTK